MREGGQAEGHIRHCDTHGAHGLLYSCPDYPPDVLAEIAAQERDFVANLQSDEWLKEQLDRGIPPEVLAVFRLFAGVPTARLEVEGRA